MEKIKTISADEKILVTVVITTYNHALYLPDAIESVLEQTYPCIELIVVDDGSTDNTGAVVSNYPSIKYIFQENKGLSSARNTGARNSSGKYITFLDADDLLYPDAIRTNLYYAQIHPECGFISGGHDLMTEDKAIIDTKEWQQFPAKNHYLALLKSDYISMHAAVLYKKEVFEYHHYDETLTSCEDYDFYLQIARDYPVFSHSVKLAAYRKHENSMSENVLNMYRSAMLVIKKQVKNPKDKSIKEQVRSGKKDIRQHYANLLLRSLTDDRKGRKFGLPFLKNSLSLLSFKDLLKIIFFYSQAFIKWISHKLTAGYKRIVRIIKGGSNRVYPKPGRVWLRDLNRTTPLSKVFGYDRGGPVDRYYIEHFLKENTACIKGNVLEIGDNDYTMAYGGDRVAGSDILHIDEANPKATIIGDLSKADHIPPEQFDCVILIQTLHLIYDFKSALSHCFRILKKGGVLLLTVPGITPIDYGEWEDTWYWSFTGNVINKLLCNYFNPSGVKVRTHGNVLVASSFLYGLGKGELTGHELDENDPGYQVIITAKAVKY